MAARRVALAKGHLAVGAIAKMEDGVRRDLIAFLPRLRRFALGLTGSRAEGDDLVQATCERAIRNIDRWTPGTRLDTWLFRIARNLFLNEQRSRRRRGPSVPLEPFADRYALDGERGALSGLTLRLVWLRLRELPEEQRTALLLITVEGLGYREAADVLGLPVGTVTSRLARARMTLRSLMEEPVA